MQNQGECLLQAASQTKGIAGEIQCRDMKGIDKSCLGRLPNCSRIVLIVGLKGSGFDWQIISLPTALVVS